MTINSRAKYLIRLDDACPTMHSNNWGALETLFDEFGVRPIVGVIPDNRDSSMMISPVDVEFWPRMRLWQTKGWEIVLHGLHHVYHPISGSQQPLLALAEKSEFVGLSLAKQKEMLAEGYSIMSDAGIRPRAFMAPSHTFDMNTLQALREATDIRIITDGHALAPFKADGFTWVPQQLWRYYDMPLGVWCICLHPNTMTQNELERLTSDLRSNAHKFIDFDEALQISRPRSVLDYSFSGLYQAALTIKRAKRHLLNLS